MHSSNIPIPQPHSHAAPSNHLNPLEAPPQALKDLFKSWRPHSNPNERQKCVELGKSGNKYKIPAARLGDALDEFCTSSRADTDVQGSTDADFGSIYTVPEIPGLMVAPSLFPPTAQKELLSRLLHRDLSNPLHKTNLHLHHEIIYPRLGGSFFSEGLSSVNFVSKDGNQKKNMDVKKALEKKMRWMTLGGQYDWTNKEYPPEEPPEFPVDVAKLIGGIFTDMEAQAAIVNLYSPGDTLSMHRDVSEEVDRGLVSISLGCEAIFIIGLHNEKSNETRSAVLRLRSGDVVYMSGESRFAWHGVPWIIPHTCPNYLADWPGNDYPPWKGWMKNKRININVRQMREESSKLLALDFESCIPSKA